MKSNFPICCLTAFSLFSMMQDALAQSPGPYQLQTFGTYYGRRSYVNPPASSSESPISVSSWVYTSFAQSSGLEQTDHNYDAYEKAIFHGLSPSFWNNDLLGITLGEIVVPAEAFYYEYPVNASDPSTSYKSGVNSETTFSGNGFTLNGSFTNDSPNKQTFNTDIALSQPSHTFAINAGSLHLGGNVSGEGASITKTGSGVLHINNLGTYTGATTVSEGRLVVDGSLQNTSLTTVAANATLAGNGSISGQVDTAGNIAPGSSIGSLQTGQINFLTFSAFLFEYDSVNAEADLLNVNGNLGIEAGATLDLTDLAVVGEILGAHTKFTLISYAGEWDGGEFDGFADDSEFVFGGNRWLINYDDTSGGLNGGNYDSFVTLSVVPEPSAALLLLPGMSMLLLRRRVAAA